MAGLASSSTSTRWSISKPCRCSGRPDPPQPPMKTKLFQIKLATRIALIALVTAVPLLGVTLFFIFTTASKDIRFGQWELYGNEYQRPLETLLQWLPQHQSLVTRARAGDGSVGSALAESEGKIDQAFALLEVVDRKLGVDLQF